MPNTSKGYPYPSGSDDVDVPGDIQALADAVDLTPGIRSYTSTQIAALAAGDKWAGRVVWNSTTSKLQVSNGSTFSDVDSTVSLSSATPQTLGTAAAGSSSDASRADHRHAMPSASDVGAIATSLVDAKGDLITATADNTPARLAAGSNGQILMADSSATAGLRYVDPAANRNLLINGAMQVAQRSSSVSNITSNGYYTADRWWTQNLSGGTWTQSVENDAPTGSGFRKSLKMTCTTAQASLASTAILRVAQLLEGQDLQRIRKGTASAQQLTLSFWVKTNVAGTYVVLIADNDNLRNAGATYSIAAGESGTWVQRIITVPADTTGAFDNDNATSLYVHFTLAGGSTFQSGSLNTSSWGSDTNPNNAPGQTNLAAATNNYWQVTGVQLETGPVATPFEFEPFEATLRKCQRYYWRAGGQSTYQPIGTGQAQSGTQAFVQVYHPVPMRTGPTAIEYSTLALTNATMSVVALTNLTLQYAGIHSTSMQATVSSGVAQGNATQLVANNSTSAYFGITAEL